jgi:hypothetical protein
MAPESEGSCPYSQQPATTPYPEPNEPTPHPQANLSLRYSLIPSSHLRLGLPNGLFTTDFSRQNLVRFLSYPTCAKKCSYCTKHPGNIHPITPRRRAFLDKLTAAQLVRKFTTFTEPLGCWDRGFESRWGNNVCFVFMCCVVLCR